MKTINEILQNKVGNIAKTTVLKHYPKLKGREFEVKFIQYGQGCPECIKGTAGHNVCYLVPMYLVKFEGHDEWKNAKIINTCFQCQNWAMGREDYIYSKRRDVEKKTKDYWIIPEDLKEATLDNFAAKDPATIEALHIARTYLKHWDENDRYNLIFRGKYGAGKSHLLKAIAGEIRKKIKKDDEPFLVGFIPMENVLTMIKASWDNKDAPKTEKQIMDELIELDFLVLDDVGTEGGDWAGRKLFEIINGRSGKPTAITTNILDWDIFEKRFAENGGKIISRLHANAKEFDILTTDKRIKLR